MALKKPKPRNGSPAEILTAISELLDAATSESPLYPPTLIYNEGWLLRIILNWFSKSDVSDRPLSFLEEASWYSEALLPSAFLPRNRGDRLAESWTHADGVIGQFTIGKEGRTDLELSELATQLTVLEAKMFSGLSGGIANADYYDQAARNVACMAEVLCRSRHSPLEMKELGFYILAPKSQIEKGLFSDLMNKKSVQRKVLRRVNAYDGEKDDWHSDWFRPTLDHIEILCLNWEGIITFIEDEDPAFGASLALFYDYCRYFNQ